MLLATQVLSLLRAIRCQTSSGYTGIRYETPEKLSSPDHAGGGGPLYSLSSSLLFWEDEQSSCTAVSMGRPSEGKTPYGSFSLLWPVFVRICVSHIVETLSCALQGRPGSTESGMSVFEHSLAFAEAESMISASFGLGLFGAPKPKDATERSNTGSNSTVLVLTRAEILERLNVTPELLMISLISCSNNLASHVLGVFGLQARYRLLNTAFWALCFMGAMVWGFLDSSPSSADEVTFLRFPTVCIVGFVPHLLILIGILTCFGIYGLALLFTAWSLPTDGEGPISFRERLAMARDNMQTSAQFQNLRFNMQEDFYTALVKVGYTCLTAASEAVFLNEGKAIVSRDMTWLEEERLEEIVALREKQKPFSQRPGQVPGTFADLDGSHLGLPEQAEVWESGYGREKKLEKRPGASSVKSHSGFAGVGAFTSVTRMYLSFTFFRGIFFLVVGWLAFGISRFLERLGITTPRWLKVLAGNVRNATQDNRTEKSQLLDFWILTDEGELQLPDDYEFDVEKEMRKREILNNGGGQWGETQERQFEGKLYDWWKAGGSWGNRDDSGDYIPPTDELDDTTSVVSMSTNDESEWASDESDGRRTPTQREPYPSYRRSARSDTPLHETLLDSASLARLLDPKDRESKEEARILASHLLAEREGTIMTRSQFRTQTERERSRILTSSRLISRSARGGNSPLGPDQSKRPTPDEEAEMLEKLILSKRMDSQQHQRQQAVDSERPEAPTCVVCHCSPRSIIAWPCRCLCVCEDCRVSLAMNNFGSCVTCRREVHGFVRLWVP